MEPGMRMLGFSWNDLPFLYDMKSRSMYKRATLQSLYVAIFLESQGKRSGKCDAKCFRTGYKV